LPYDEEVASILSRTVKGIQNQ